MSCAVVEGAEVCGAEGVILEFFAVVEVAVACDVAVAEGKAEGIVVRTLKDSAAGVYDRPDIAQMVGDVVLRRIRSCTGVSRQLPVRRQEVSDGKTSVIDEVAAETDMSHR